MAGQWRQVTPGNGVEFEPFEIRTGDRVVTHSGQVGTVIGCDPEWDDVTVVVNGQEDVWTVQSFEIIFRPLPVRVESFSHCVAGEPVERRF